MGTPNLAAVLLRGLEVVCWPMAHRLWNCSQRLLQLEHVYAPGRPCDARVSMSELSGPTLAAPELPPESPHEAEPKCVS